MDGHNWRYGTEEPELAACLDGEAICVTTNGENFRIFSLVLQQRAFCRVIATFHSFPEGRLFMQIGNDCSHTIRGRLPLAC